MILGADGKRLSKRHGAVNGRWMNQHYLKTLSPEQSVKEWMWQMRNRHLNPDLWALQARRFKTIDELVAESQYFYQDIELDAAIQSLIQEASMQPLLLLGKKRVLERLARY